MRSYYLLFLAPFVSLNASAANYPLIPGFTSTGIPSNGGVSDPLVFNAEFYQKYNNLSFASTSAATADWTSRGAAACLRGAATFSAVQYKGNYSDISQMDCASAALHYVQYGFYGGRVGTNDFLPEVFDINYYTDQSVNPDLSSLYTKGTWSTVDLQIHWLQHGLSEGRSASPLFSPTAYRNLYGDLGSMSLLAATAHYSVFGRQERRLGIAWADPSLWQQVISNFPKVSPVAQANGDIVRTFTSASLDTVSIVVKAPVPSSKKITCIVSNPGSSDASIIQGFLNRGALSQSDSNHCDIVQLPPNQTYHLSAPSTGQPHLSMTGSDFVLDGQNSTLMFQGNAIGIQISGQRSQVKNLNLDYDPNYVLYAAIGTIVNDSSTTAHINLDSNTVIPKGFAPVVMTLNLFDRTNGRVASDDNLNYQINDSTVFMSFSLAGLNLTPVSGHNVDPTRLTPWNGRAVLVRSMPVRGLSAVYVYGNASDTQITNSVIYGSPGMGLTAWYNTRGLALSGLKILKSATERPISTCIDGIHVTGMQGDIVIENGEVGFQGDDGINVGVMWQQVTGINSNGDVVFASQARNPSVGDKIAFFDSTVGFLGELTVTQANGNTLHFSSNPGWLKASVYGLDETFSASRVLISNMSLHDNLSRGIIMMGNHALMQNNTIQYTAFSGIMLNSSFTWKEGWPASDIAMRNNQLNHSNFVHYAGRAAFSNAAVSVSDDAEYVASGVTAWNTLPVYPLHQHVELFGNSLQSDMGAGVFISESQNVKFQNNQLLGCPNVANPTGLTNLYFGTNTPAAAVFQRVGSLIGSGNTTDTQSCIIQYDYASMNGMTLTQ